MLFVTFRYRSFNIIELLWTICDTQYMIIALLRILYDWLVLKTIKDSLRMYDKLLRCVTYVIDFNE